MIKKGVFENLEYPWFAPKMQVFESGAVQDMCGEDVSFCLDAKEEGYDIWCDRIRVGHEKLVLSDRVARYKSQGINYNNERWRLHCR